MNENALVGLFQQIDAYIKTKQKFLASGNPDEIRKISHDYLLIFNASKDVKDVNEAVDLFSNLLEQQIMADRIVPLFGVLSDIPDQETFAYRLDNRGWIFIRKGETAVYFVDSELYRFDQTEDDAENQTSMLWYALGIVFAILIMVSVVFYKHI